MHRLKAAEIHSLPAGVYHDGGGLYLIKTTPTSGSWIYRWGGNKLGLGSTLLVGLAKAREKAQACRELRADGLDPRAQRDADRVEAKIAVAKATTFDECRERYHAAHKPGWRNAKHAEQWDGSLKLYASPIIGALPVSAVDVALVMQILEPIWTAKPETARRLRQRIEAVLDWAKARDMRTGENPARWKGHLDKLLPKISKVRTVRHHAALPYAELPAFMAALRAQQGIAARAVEFCILCCSRGDEVRGAPCGEFDLAAKAWTIPGPRMKGGLEHRSPLSPRAVEIVTERMEEARKAAKDGDISTARLFPGAKPGKGLADVTMTSVLRRMGLNVTLHGFRSSFRDWAAERTNFQRELAEKALAHLVGDETERAYQRGDLFAKRARLMDAWGSFASTPPRAGVVVPIKGARAS
jgi:integrase